MTLSELARRPAPWLTGNAPDRDIVLSSRVRLARNLQGHRFTHVGAQDELRVLRAEILAAAGAVPRLAGASLWTMEELQELERRFLLERHLISVDLVNNVLGRAVLVSPDEGEGMMINEEDHLRLQTFASGLAPGQALARAWELCAALEEHLHFAFSDRWGYLTACPTNVGTGLRASILVHLPGLVLTGDIDKVLNGLRRLKYTVRGFYGEGSGAMGALFQISNSVTLGRSDEGIVDELLHHTRKVITCEREARAVLLQREPHKIEDRVWRALGVLTHCRLLSTKEAFELLGEVRLGVGLKVLTELDESVLNTLLMDIQSAHLQVVSAHPMDPSERDEARATHVREVLARSMPRKDDLR
jgi:protein arginine kinase